MTNIVKTYRMVVNRFYDIMEPGMKISISKFPDPTIIKHLYGQEALEFYRFILGNLGLTCVESVFKIQFVIKKGELIQLNVFKISDDNEYIKRSIDYPMDKSEKWPKVLKDIFGISFPIKVEPKFKRWIPCSERLPDTRNNILICQRNGYVSVGYFQCQERFLDLNSVPFDDVIAWQPLPEPYREL